MSDNGMVEADDGVGRDFCMVRFSVFTFVGVITILPFLLGVEWPCVCCSACDQKVVNFDAGSW